MRETQTTDKKDNLGTPFAQARWRTVVYMKVGKAMFPMPKNHFEAGSHDPKEKSVALIARTMED